MVGSRNAAENLLAYTHSTGRLTAQAGCMLVSGGARGIDRAAMRGALEGGGTVTAVLADSLEKTALTRENRNMIMDGRLTLLSPYDPNAGFNIGNAMARNKLIYALADAALVVTTGFGTGGTWAGATEQLERLDLVPVYVRIPNTTDHGIQALRQKGALDWPDPKDPISLRRALRPDSTSVSAAALQMGLPL